MSQQALARFYPPEKSFVLTAKNPSMDIQYSNYITVQNTVHEIVDIH